MVVRAASRFVVRPMLRWAVRTAGTAASGGDIWLVADRNTASLIAFRDHPHRKATSGAHGSGKKRHGARGEDLQVFVPVGTQIIDYDGTLLADLVNEGDRWLAAAGGQGGKGNARFLSNKRRAPGFAEQGEVGEERWLRLELKLMADVALVGFPNVGKSTLISRISAAKPKIADYPFTTLEPNLGVVRLDADRSADGSGARAFEMVVADIPGLIEGAAEGRGLGHQFLRHIERARVLLLLLDRSPMSEMTPAEQEAVLLTELGDYQPDLLDRPRLAVGSRADLAVAGDPVHEFDGLERVGGDRRGHPAAARSAPRAGGVRACRGRSARGVRHAPPGRRRASASRGTTTRRSRSTAGMPGGPSASRT